MADEFIMPKLGLTMESGKIIKWLVDDAAPVVAGQTVLLIETDKVESEVEATSDGLLHQTGNAGEEYDCGVPIGWYLAPGEQPPTPVVASSAAPSAPAPAIAAPKQAASPGATVTRPPGSRLLASPNARRLAAEAGIDLQTIVGTGPEGMIVSEDLAGAHAAPTAVAPAAPRRSGGLSLATAGGRQLAELLGIDIAQVAVRHGQRATRADVAAHVRGLLSQPVASAQPKPTAAPTQTPTAVIPMSGMRGTIAERMAASLRESAQLTLTMDVDMDGVVADRARRKAAADADTPVPSFTDYVIAATAQALGDHPYANSQIVDDGVALLPGVHVGMAVAVDDGLMVPVVQDTPSYDLDELAAETSRLAIAARQRKLTVDEVRGGTFSVTALGMFDVDAFTPIINAPNTAILGVGRLRDDVAWTDDDRPTKTKRLTLSLTWDHRAFDGAPAAEFTQAIKRRLEAYAP